MVFNKEDFSVLNISNIPVTEEKIKKLISLFNNNSLSFEDLINKNFYAEMDYSKESFRKVINHCAILGLFDMVENKYQLSKVSMELYREEITFNGFLIRLIQENSQVYRVTKVVIALLKFFSSSLRLKTLYVLFSLVSKGRTDESAQASVGRNLRAYFALLNMLGLIKKNKDRLYLNEVNNLTGLFECNELEPIYKQFQQDIINVNLISKYLSNFFDRKIVEQILSCVSTYEIKNYVWSKSSLYKNQGEIRNLYGEYIMTVIIKER